MPLVACPKCATNLRVPDGVAAAVKCPKCQTIFQPPRPQPAFEVVEDEPTPPKPPPPAPRPAVPVAAKPVPAPKPSADFEVVDDEPKKPAKRVTARTDDDDEDDDRPRKKRRRDEDNDDDDDRPRSRRKGRDDDDEDEDDDRPRKKKRRRDDEDDWADSGSKKVGGAAAAKTGMLLVSISLWMYLGTFALLTLFMLVGWFGGYISTGLMIIPGILGLGNWVVGAVGLGYCIAGPARSRGLAIAAAAVAGVHLILTFVVANNTDAGLFSDRTIQVTALHIKQANDARLMEDAAKDQSRAKAMEERNNARKEFVKAHEDEIFGLLYYEAKLEAREKGKSTDDAMPVLEFKGLKAPEGMRWVDAASQLPFLDKFLAVVSYYNKSFGEYVIGLLGGVIELARLVLMVLLVGSVSKSVKGNEAADKAKYGLIAVGAAAGVAVLVSLLAGVMVDGARSDLKKIYEGGLSGTDFSGSDPAAIEKKFKDLRDKAKSAEWMMRNAPAAGRFLNFLLFTGMLAIPAVAALQASSEAGRRIRG